MHWCTDYLFCDIIVLSQYVWKVSSIYKQTPCIGSVLSFIVWGSFSLHNKNIHASIAVAKYMLVFFCLSVYHAEFHLNSGQVFCTLLMECKMLCAVMTLWPTTKPPKIWLKPIESLLNVQQWNVGNVHFLNISENANATQTVKQHLQRKKLLWHHINELSPKLVLF